MMAKKKAKSKIVAMLRNADQPSDYPAVLDGLTTLIADSRRRVAIAVNRELVRLYWQIGSVILHQQEHADWGDGVVEQLAVDLRTEFQDVRRLTKDNLFRMRKFAISCSQIEYWLAGDSAQALAAKGVPSSAKKWAQCAHKFGLEEEHSEKELRHAILSNLYDCFLEFGRDLTFVGEEYPLSVGNDTFSIDLLFVL